MINRRCVLPGSPGVLLCILLGGAAAAGESERLATEQAMHTLTDAGQYEQAREAANLLIEFTTDEFGDNSPELIDPLIALGNIERHLSHPERAVEAYEKASALIESNESVFSERLVSVLRNIGQAYLEEQHGEDAAAALQRAQVITHRNYGIMNLQQIPIIDDLTEVYASDHDWLSANREQLFAMRINERRFGNDSPEVVPGLYRLATWYKRTGQWSGARDLYRRAVAILEAAYGSDDVRLVPALTGIADCYKYEHSMRDEGRESLERAVHVYETSEDADRTDHGASLIALGDWNLLSNEREEAVELYSRAWQLLSADGKDPAPAQKALGLPQRLRYEPPAPELDPDAMQTETGETPFVEIEFTVTENGAIADPVIVNTNASNRVVRQVRLSILQARYRPGFTDGRATPMRVRLRQIYPGGYGATTIAAKGGKHEGKAKPAGVATGEPSVETEAVTPAGGSRSEVAPSSEALPPSAGAPAGEGVTSGGDLAPTEDAGTTEPAFEEAPATAPPAEPEPETP
jgi:tetratricopeptide (TPR) repeat protein